VAVNYYVTPSLNLIASYYLDYAQNIVVSWDTGTRNSFLLVADYYFTKNFDVYLAGSDTMFSGNLENTSNGGDEFSNNTGHTVSNVFSAMLGMRFRF
jgi:predicted porin